MACSGQTSRRTIGARIRISRVICSEGATKGTAMKNHRRLLWAGVSCLAFVVAVTAAPQSQDKAATDKDSVKDVKDKDKRPKLTLTARPPIGMSPARIAITAELVGGPNDLEDFYCPTIEWDWGDV